MTAGGITENRLWELADRASRRGQWTHTEFLSLAEQDTLLRLRLDAPFTLTGGFTSAERKIAMFGSEDLCGYVEEPPIVCVKIEPVNVKFADNLTHRDFLGSLMALGLRREVMGDILVIEKRGWLFCLDSVADFIVRELAGVRHTTVRCALSDPPAEAVEEPEISEFVTASERLDALIAAVYKLSRSGSQELISGGKVYLSGRLVQSPDTPLNEGTIVSVRGTGRFRYEGIARETKKGKLRVLARVYR